MQTHRCCGTCRSRLCLEPFQLGKRRTTAGFSNRQALEDIVHEMKRAGNSMQSPPQINSLTLPGRTLKALSLLPVRRSITDVVRVLATPAFIGVAAIAGPVFASNRSIWAKGARLLGSRIVRH